ncbi:MAG: hypothetical protein ABSG33_03330 [Candidatus Bathyarchaeia archaeon]|jgi:hypothetical protein
MTEAKKSLRDRIRGWFPQDPKLSSKYAEKQKDEKRTDVLNRPLYEVNFDTIVTVLPGFLLVLFGILGFVFNDLALATVQSIAMFVPLGFFIGYLFTFWIVVVAIIAIVVLVRTHTVNRAFFKRNFTKRRLLPWGISAILIYSTYLASNSGTELAYAVPITFLVSGVIVFLGLKKFAVTLPAFAVLLICMLVFGCAVAGANTVTYVWEDRGLTAAQAPNVNAVNLTARSMEGDIRLYFTADASQVCKIQYMKEYGVVTTSVGTQYHGPSQYVGEPASGFNYTIDNHEANILATSYTTLINITVNQNLEGNFNFYTYYGDITVNVPPNVGTIQKLNLTSVLGAVHFDISNATDLQSITAKTNATVQAQITSTTQTQDATVQLNGGTVKLTLDVNNIRSEIFAYQTSNWGTLQANTQGFLVMNKTNSYFNAQTTNYATASLKRLDVNATSDQSTTAPSMAIAATYGQK